MMNRRDLIRHAALSVFAAKTVGGGHLFAQNTSQPALGFLEQRVAGWLAAYDAQGNHRTGTDVDNASAQWLAQEARQAGAAVSVESFSLSRVDPQSCYLRVGEHRVDGVPLFDGGFTGLEGVEGTIGPPGSDAEIALVESPDEGPQEPSAEQRDDLAEARRSQVKAIVAVRHGARPGLYLQNASRFLTPYGPPVLQVSSVHLEWLRANAAARSAAAVVTHVKREASQAHNVTARIAGRNPALGPIVLMAPRSGWWQCVSEQGSRLVCMLEAMRTLAVNTPERDCLFVAFSGHELGFLGMDPYVNRRPDLIKRAHAWIFFGSDIGSPKRQNRIHASDAALEHWGIAALAEEGLAVDSKAPHDANARGETIAIQRGAGRFFTVVCPSDVFHSPADRWPDAVDVSVLAKYARAFANGALRLANEPG